MTFVVRPLKKILKTNSIRFFSLFDAGASKADFRLVSTEGILLEEAEYDIGNIFRKTDGYSDRIISAVREMFYNAGIEREAIYDTLLFGGIAGLEISAARASLDVFDNGPFAASGFAHDGHIACLGVNGSDQGGIVGLGTGSYAGYCKAEGFIKIGGWGSDISDLGSGFRLARSLLEKTLLAYDGLIPKSKLTDLMLKKFQNSPEEICLFLRSAGQKEVAELAPLIFEYAEKGDFHAGNLLFSALEDIQNLTDMVLNKDLPIKFSGGLASSYRPYLEERYGSEAFTTSGTPLDGAFIMAKEFLGAIQSNVNQLTF